MYSSYHSGKNDNFSQLSEQISSSIQKISQNVVSVKKMVAQVGTSSDSEDLRGKLHDIQHYTNQLAKDTSELLKKMQKLPPSGDMTEQRQRKIQKERLVSDFGTILNTFQQTQKDAAQKEKESLNRMRASSQGILGYPGDDKRNNQLIQLESPVQNQMMQVDEVDLDLLREREEAMQQLETDIVSVNEIFRDVAAMVHEQGEIVDSIEANMESTQIHVSDASQQLSKARDYQTKARKMKFVLFIIALIVVAIIIGVIVHYTKD